MASTAPIDKEAVTKKTNHIPYQRLVQRNSASGNRKMLFVKPCDPKFLQEKIQTALGLHRDGYFNLPWKSRIIRKTSALSIRLLPNVLFFFLLRRFWCKELQAVSLGRHLIGDFMRK
jgi:hypothetical protein